jgi:hypothetical protein
MAVVERQRRDGRKHICSVTGRLGTYAVCIVRCYLSSENVDCKYR